MNGVVGFEYNNVKYYYLKNVQGDITAIYDEAGNLNAEYEYDAWGNHVVTLDVGGIGSLNPFRYRSYYFDEETGLYYLNSRYYDPEVGRFINADSFVSTGQGILGHNMFAYCDNGPINKYDPLGDIAITTLILIGSIVVGVLAAAHTAATSYKYTKQVDIKNTIFNGLCAFAVVYTCGMSAYGLYLNFCYDYGYIPVTEIGPVSSDKVVQVYKSGCLGWNVGDDLTNLTINGNEPSWSTLRQRYWKNEAYFYSYKYDAETLERLKKGYAPICEDGFSMELHHPYGREGDAFYIFYPVTKTEHMKLHK